MANGWLIAAVAAGGYLLVRAMTKPKPASTCDSLCTGSGDPGGHAACVVACNLAGGVLGELAAVNPFHDSSTDVLNAAKSADKQNGVLNGAVKTPRGLPYAVSGGIIAGNVLEYQNGCQPFAGAPGWGKCAAGTQSMWGVDVAVVSGDYEGVSQAPPTGNISGYYVDAQVDEDHFVSACIAAGDAQSPACMGPAINPARFLTGLEGDPTTYKIDSRDAGGKLQWRVRDQLMSCPNGTAPAELVFGVNAGSAAPPELAGQCIPIGTKGQLACSVDANHKGHAPTGFSWVDDPTGGAVNGRVGRWVPSSGGAVNDGPCAVTAGVQLGAGNALGIAGGGNAIGLVGSTANAHARAAANLVAAQKIQ